MSNRGIYGCDTCEDAGRMGCPIHRDWTVPVLAPEMHGPTPDIQGHLARLASARFDRILELEREMLELRGEVAMLRDRLAKYELCDGCDGTGLVLAEGNSYCCGKCKGTGRTSV